MAGTNETSEENKIDLVPILYAVWKQFTRTWFIGILCVALCGAFGFYTAWRSYTPSYVAEASFLVSSSNSGSTSIDRYYNRVSTQQLTATFPYILTSGALSKVVAEDLGVSSVPGIIAASMLGDTNILQISVTASDGQTAYDVLQSVIENYPTVAKYIIGNTTITLLEDNGVPTSPSNSRSYRGSVLRYMIAGFAVYLIILLFLSQIRRSVNSKGDLQRYINAPYLGGIPLVRFKKRSAKKSGRGVLLDNKDLPDSYLESMDDLQIRFTRTMREKKWKTVLVTSALAGEGKTTIASNLALSLADKGANVLLIDGDLRNPSLNEQLNQPDWKNGGGLADYLKGKRTAEKLIRVYPGKKLYVLPGGRPEDHTAALYTNGLFEDLLERYKGVMDYIIIDTPPCSFLHDTSLIAPFADAGILVVRQDYAPADRIVAGAEILTQADTPLAGCILNGIHSGAGRYGYGYGYGYGNYGKYGESDSAT